MISARPALALHSLFQARLKNRCNSQLYYGSNKRGRCFLEGREFLADLSGHQSQEAVLWGVAEKESRSICNAHFDAKLDQNGVPPAQVMRAQCGHQGISSARVCRKSSPITSINS